MSEITTIGLDLAKTVFQLHGADASGRAVRRGWVLEVLAGLSAARWRWGHDSMPIDRTAI
jgi:hypothetical protein